MHTPGLALPCEHSSLQKLQEHPKALKATYPDHIQNTNQSDETVILNHIWSQQRFSLALSLSSIHEKHTLWVARHTASRSGGGLALSPISAAVNAAEAGFHQSSHDVATSLIDDVLRRMIVTLPDFR